MVEQQSCMAKTYCTSYFTEKFRGYQSVCNNPENFPSQPICNIWYLTTFLLKQALISLFNISLLMRIASSYGVGTTIVMD